MRRASPFPGPVSPAGLLLACLGLVSCGGGGGGPAEPADPPPVGQPRIYGAVMTIQAGSELPGLGKTGNNTSVYVSVANQDGSAQVSTANVTANGIVLPYDTATGEYTGVLGLDPGEPVAVVVAIGDVTYTATASQFSTYPTIVAPRSGTTWSVRSNNVVSWTGIAPDSNVTYGLAALDPRGVQVWPKTFGAKVISTSYSSETIEPYGLTVGDRVILLGLTRHVPVAGAVLGSGVLVGAFDYAWVTVVAKSGALSAISTNPATASLGVGKTIQLAAVGHFEDGGVENYTGEVTWSSSDPGVVTVSSTGLITGIAGGSAVITAEKGGVSGSATVVVLVPQALPDLPLTSSVAYQVDFGHSGRATVGPGGPEFPPAAQWSRQLNGQVSYPVFSDGRVFVTTDARGEPGFHGSSLYAIDLASGDIDWGPVMLPEGWGLSLPVYDQGRLIVMDGRGHLRSFEPTTGAAESMAQLEDVFLSAPPVAANGIVYIGAEGDIVAVHEETGVILWKTWLEWSESGAPTVSGDGVFVAYPCRTYKLDPLSGAVAWRYEASCSSTGHGWPSAYAAGRLYTLDMYGTVPNRIHDAADGTLLGTFSATAAPAIGVKTGFFLDGGALSALDLATGDVTWSFEGDGQLVSAPVLIDDVVVVASSSGALYALGAASGTLLWTGSAGTMVQQSDWRLSRPLPGIGVGDGWLVVPAGDSLTAWKIKP